ncbi:hypothetical protein LTR16_010456, partial [Cryomyces antarcticus]
GCQGAGCGLLFLLVVQGLRPAHLATLRLPARSPPPHLSRPPLQPLHDARRQAGPGSLDVRADRVDPDADILLRARPAALVARHRGTRRKPRRRPPRLPRLPQRRDRLRRADGGFGEARAD